jgi:ferredoxin
MPFVRFKPKNISIEVDSRTKILVSARKAGVPIRFGCASARCGTCAVRITPSEAVCEMDVIERALLERMKLPLDGTVRLSCQARVSADVEVDMDFQDTYSPDDGDEF